MKTSSTFPPRKHSLPCQQFCFATQYVLLSALAVLEIGIANAATPLNGNVSGTLSLANSPYLVTADLYINGGQTLTIEPGVVIQFQNADHALVIDGSLVARGAAAAPILFTSEDIAKAPGQWEALIFRGANTNSILENCVIECAAAQGFSDESIRLESASPTFRNCTVRQSRVHGMTLLYSDALIESCQFLNNGSGNANGFPIWMRSDSLPRLKNNTATGNAHNAIGVFDYGLGRNGTWPKDNLPYTLVNDLYVNSGTSFTLEPGVVLQFQNADTAFVIDGTLIARGTAGAPIQFTSDELQKAPGQWEAIIFRGPNTNSILENCIVEYGAAAGVCDESIRLESASPTLRNCAIRQSRMHGLTLFFSDPLLENCQFLNNGSTNANAFPIWMRSDSLPRFKNVTAQGNVRDAIGVFDYNLNRNGTWVKDILPYTLVNDVYVNSGTSFTLEPGVVLQFQNVDTAFVIDGTLIAKGSATAPILFTSDEIQKSPGQWEAIIFRGPNTNSILENCIVEYGAAPGVSDELIRIESASAVIRNCTVRQSRMHGLTLLFSDSLLENCQFLNNGSTNANAFPIWMRSDSLPRLKNVTASGNVHNAIGVFDYNLARNGTWVKDNLPYTLVNELYVNSGKTFTLEPGTIVQFQERDTALVVDGTLIAQGTTNAPIRFTSDDTQKAPGQWEAIIFRSTATNSILENCIVEYGAGAGVSDELVRFENAFAVIRNCTLSNSRKDGIRFQFSDPVIENCRFLDNGTTNNGFAMTMRVDSLPRLRNNLATGNGHDAIAVFDYNFSRNGTWLKDNLPYTLANDVFVNNGAKLTIESGTILQFQNPDTALVVDGTLVAQGAANAPIRFTSDEAVKAPGQWEAVIFRASNKNSILENCLIEYAAAAGVSDEAVRFEDATATLRNCTIRNSRKDGIRFQFADPVIENCQFLNNGATNNGFAMVMRSDSFPKLKNNLAAGNGRDAIAVFGSNFYRTGVWPRDGLPYTIVEDIFINAGKMLTIEPGVVVQFQDPDDALVMDGALKAQGLATAPIRFTSDDAVKKPGQWEGIIFRDTADDGASILENCQIEYGGANTEGELGLFSASPRLLRCGITQSLNDGIHANNSAASVQNCRITQNGRDGVRAVNQSTLSVNNSTIAGNKEFGARNYDTARIVNARSNFWGDPSGPLDNSDADGRGQTNPNGKGDKVSEYVDWSGFLPTDPLTPIPAQKIEVAPASLDFGNVIVGQSQELFLAVRNTGGLDLSVTSVTSDNSRFRVVSPSTPFTVAAGLQQAISVSFAADTAASATGTLTLKCNDAGQPSISVSLKANGVVAGECLAPPSGLVGWWPGDGNFLNQVGTNHAQPLGGVSFSSGKAGQSFSFANDGDRITIPHDPSLDVQAPGFTVEFWMRGGKDQPQDLYLAVDKSHGWADSTGWMFQGYSRDGRIYFGIGRGGGSIDNFAVVTSATDVLDSIFHHVAGTWDGSTVRLYVDSVLQGEAAHAAPVNNTRPVNLGYSWGGGSPNRFFRGQLDELSIYRRALTTNEIQAVFYAGAGGKCKQAASAPSLSFSPSSLDFGGVAVGQTKDLALTIKNSGQAALTVKAITSDNARFSVVSPAVPFNVAPGAEQAVLVRFAPASAGAQGGLLSITSNDPAQAKVTVVVSGNGAGANPSELVVNGGFESPDFVGAFQIRSAGEIIDGWTVDSAGVIHVGTFWQNAAGNHSVELNSNAAGGISQALATEPGQTYQVSFDVAGQPGCGGAVKELQVFWDGVLVGTEKFDTTGRTVSEMGWSRRTLLVQATRASTVLRFFGAVPASTDCGPGLDNVSVVKASAPSGNCISVPAGLLGWWSGEGDASDRQTNRPGVLHGATFAAGRVGQAFRFNGIDDYVDLGPWNAGAAWTVEAWVKPSSAPAGRRTIAGGVSDCLDWGIAMQDGQFGVIIRQPGGCTDTVRSAATAAVADTWYHIAGTCDGTTATIYVNGQAKGTASVEPNYAGTMSGARIGGEVCCGGNNFPGLIDEVSIYTRALSAGEIQAIFAADSAGKCSETPPLTSVKLSLVRADNQIVISWPASAGNVTLQRTFSLSPPVQWSPLSTVPTVINGQSTVTIPMASIPSATAFLRASQP